MIYKSLLDLIGNTPIIDYEGIFIKLEQFNLAGSVKDRVALNIINELENHNILNESSTVIEVTSGNTGIAIAMICAIKRYKCIIIMPDDVPNNVVSLIKAFGAKFIFIPSILGLEYGIKIAKKLEKENGYIYLNQFNNINNPLAHQTTSQEIIQDFKKLDYLVCGIGSAGTICGLSKSLKEAYSNIKIIGVLPKESTSKINGIGANIKSSFIDDKLIDDIIIVDGDEVKKEYVKLANKGLLVGLSSVACFIASKRIKMANPEKIILMISADNGNKYVDLVDLGV